MFAEMFQQTARARNGFLSAASPDESAALLGGSIDVIISALLLL